MKDRPNPLAHLVHRPRRLRRTQTIRDLVHETDLTPERFVWPVFVTTGTNVRDPISSMPGVFRLSTDELLKDLKTAKSLGVMSIALFPHIEDALKNPMAHESKNRNGLLPKTVQEIKNAYPEMCVITDVAMDPYSSDGHDGLLKNGEILNDETLDVLSAMALVQAQAGADFVAPSDMMDGRVAHIRQTLDGHGFTNVGIISYAAKYASTFYGPFRDALDSAPKSGDKKTYQMDPRNQKEALREVHIDIAEGADIVMVKPALAYLDIIARVKDASSVPVAAYNVSGEYAMVKLMVKNGYADEQKAIFEVLTAIRRAGADLIFTYHALEAARALNRI
jgi:porphobilinogen synthase